MNIKKDLRKNHWLYNEYLGFLKWDSTKYNLFKNTDNDFFEWVKSFEIDSDWQDPIDVRKRRV